MNSDKGLKALGIIHKAMLAGLVLFSAVFFYLVYTTKQSPSIEANSERILEVIGIMLSAAGFFAGTTIFKKKMAQARDMQGSAKEKFTLFWSACIIQWVLIEGPCIINGVFFFLTGNYAFLALAAALIIFFFLMAPTKDKALLQLGLSEQELTDL